MSNYSVVLYKVSNVNNDLKQNKKLTFAKLTYDICHVGMLKLS